MTSACAADPRCSTADCGGGPVKRSQISRSSIPSMGAAASVCTVCIVPTLQAERAPIKISTTYGAPYIIGADAAARVSQLVQPSATAAAPSAESPLVASMSVDEAWLWSVVGPPPQPNALQLVSYPSSGVRTRAARESWGPRRLLTSETRLEPWVRLEADDASVHAGVRNRRSASCAGSVRRPAKSTRRVAVASQLGYGVEAPAG